MKKPTNKLALAAIAICLMIGLVMLFGAEAADITYNSAGGSVLKLADQGDGTHARIDTGRAQYSTTMAVVGVTEDTGFSLVDLSDTANFPHSSTNNVVITGCYIEAAVSSAEAWDIAIGTVTAVDGSGVTVTEICGIHNTWQAITLSADVTMLFPNGGILDSDMMSVDLDITAFTLLTNIAGPAGNTQAAVGDIVIFVDEQSGSAGLTFSATLTYWTK